MRFQLCRTWEQAGGFGHRHPCLCPGFLFALTLGREDRAPSLWCQRGQAWACGVQELVTVRLQQETLLSRLAAGFVSSQSGGLSLAPAGTWGASLWSPSHQRIVRGRRLMSAFLTGTKTGQGQGSGRVGVQKRYNCLFFCLDEVGPSHTLLSSRGGCGLGTSYAHNDAFFPKAPLQTVCRDSDHRCYQHPDA